MEMTKKERCEFFRSYRISQGLTVEELSRKLGFRENIWTAYENGYTVPDNRSIYKMCECLSEDFEVMLEKRVCKHCGTPFYSRTPNGKFCCDTCRLAHYRETVKVVKVERKKKVRIKTVNELARQKEVSYGICSSMLEGLLHEENRYGKHQSCRV